MQVILGMRGEAQGIEGLNLLWFCGKVNPFGQFNETEGGQVPLLQQKKEPFPRHKPGQNSEIEGR
ncbi:MAG: hypothetical protein GC205_08455 [Bacteroidetes bacterium]|nr:hypothetical protein [Bacteroidota bacterium]